MIMHSDAALYSFDELHYTEKGANIVIVSL